MKPYGIIYCILNKINNKKYIGKTLEKREKELDRWIDETKVEIEAFENYIKGLEDFLTMDAQQAPY